MPDKRLSAILEPTMAPTRRSRRAKPGPGLGIWSAVSNPDLIGLFIGPLEELGIPYMITGGVAAVICAERPCTWCREWIRWLRTVRVPPS